MSTCFVEGLPTHAVKGSQGGGGGGGCTEGWSERGGGIEPMHGAKGKMVGGATRERATREGDKRSDKRSIRERL